MSKAFREPKAFLNSMETEPEKNLPAMFREVYEGLACEVIEAGPCAVLIWSMPDGDLVQFQAQHPEIPHYPQLQPLVLTHTGTAAQQRAEERAAEKRDNLITQINNVASYYHKCLIMSSPPAFIKKNSDHILGLAGLSVKEILTRLQADYSKLTADQVTEFKAFLKIRKPDEQKFADFAVAHLKVYESMAAGGHTICQYDQCTNLINAISHLPHFREAIKIYKTEVADIGTWKFDDLVAAVTKHAPNFVAEDLGYSAQSAKATEPEPKYVTVEMFAQAMAALAAQNNGQRSNNKRSRAAPAESTEAYCFLCGYNCGHKGIDCPHMKRLPGTFSMQHLLAAEHTVVVNGTTGCELRRAAGNGKNNYKRNKRA